MALDVEARNRHFDRLFAKEGLMWMGQNTNHAAPHPAVLEAIDASLAKGEYHVYAPPLGFEELRGLVLQDLGLPSGEFSVLVTDGAIEGLYHSCRTLLSPGDEMIVTDPGWLWPRRFAASSGARIVELPIFERAQGYRLAPRQLAEAITEKTRLVYLVDPSNPLGSAQSAEEIEAIAAILREKGILLIHDCTYRHFAGKHTLSAPFYPEGVLTTYSFSKWLGIAGMRLGAVVAAPDLIATLAEAPPNNLGANVVSQRAAIAGLRHKSDWFPAVQAAQLANQTLIREALADLQGLEIAVWPSNGNFLSIVTGDPDINVEAFCQHYLEHDILIRQGGYHTARFADRFVKVSTTVPRDWVEAFCARLPEALEASRQPGRSVTLY